MSPSAHISLGLYDYWTETTLDSWRATADMKLLRLPLSIPVLVSAGFSTAGLFAPL